MPDATFENDLYVIRRRIEKRTAETENPDLISGEWVMRCERRTLDDIRALGGNSPEDELRFATVARVSEINRGLYHSLVSPAVRSQRR